MREYAATRSSCWCSMRGGWEMRQPNAMREASVVRKIGRDRSMYEITIGGEVMILMS